MKKIIFVGGTAFSGSTLMAMVLANDPKGYACGEPRNFFYPTRSHQVNSLCSCGDVNCPVWKEIREHVSDNVYESIFSIFPEKEFIVDSSKDPFWIRWWNQRLEEKGIEKKNILIWKSPIEIAESFRKRGRLKDWKKSWIAYHRIYFSLISEWRAVEYRRFTNDEMVLQKMCEYLGIPYFSDKYQYWERAHHLVGGNHSAKIHLYDKGSSLYKRSIAKDPSIVGDIEGSHRSFYYHPVTDELLKTNVQELVEKSKTIPAILDLLITYDMMNEKLPPQRWLKMQYPWHQVQLRRLKRSLDILIGKFRYANMHR